MDFLTSGASLSDVQQWKWICVDLTDDKSEEHLVSAYHQHGGHAQSGWMEDPSNSSRTRLKATGGPQVAVPDSLTAIRSIFQTYRPLLIS